MLIIRLISTEIDRFQPLSQFEKGMMMSQYQKGKFDKVTGKITFSSIFAERLIPDSLIGVPISKIGDLYITESHDQLLRKAGYTKAEVADGGDLAIRIALGLCIYLSTLPSTTPHRSEWQKHRGERDRKAITDGAEICTVSSIFKLTTEEKEIVRQMHGRATVELSAHFRRGHWRRPPGQGQNPKAMKTVWVRPCLVRKDKLEEGQIVGGAVTQLT